MSARMSNVARIPQREIEAQPLTDYMLHQIMPNCLPQRRASCRPYLIAAMHEFDITTKRRAAAFLATIAHESAELKYFRELASGAAYENRKDLGNTQPGDGRKYRGRGVIQITGRSNSEACLKALRLPAGRPEALEQVENAFRSAGWFWKVRKLNLLADQNEFLKLQIRVNGMNRKTHKPNHWEQRLAYYNRALATLPNGWTLTEEVEIAPIDHAVYHGRFNGTTNYPPSPPSSRTEEDPNDEPLDMPNAGDKGEVIEGTGPYDPPVEVEAAAPAKERTTKSLVSTVTATLSSIGLSLGALVTQGVDSLKQNPELVVLIAVATIAILVCYVVYLHRQTKLDLADRAHAKEVTLETMKIRSDPARFNVEVAPRAVPPDPATVGG